jgi:hypothetical protein
MSIFKRIILFILFGLLTIFGLLLVVGYLMLPEPHEYFIKHPEIIQERVVLQNKLRAELENFERLKKEPSFISSALNDLDRNCPMDITPDYSPAPKFASSA